MKFTSYILLTALTLAISCKDFEDADLTKRKGFIRFFSSGTDFEGAVAEEDADGNLIIGANIPAPNGRYDAYIIKADAFGQKLWEQIIPSTTVNAILPYNNGYFVLGDSIEIKGGDIPSEFVNTRTRLLFMDKNSGTINPNQFIKRVRIPRNSFQGDNQLLEVDYHGDAMRLNGNELLVLGSFRFPGDNTQSFIASLNPDNLSATPNWIKSYGLQDRDYVNCNSLFTANSKLVWASRTFKEVQDLSRQYVSISFVEPNSTFENNSLYGQTDAINFTVEDLEKSAVGFAIVGTAAASDNSNARMFFMRVDENGNVISGSERYFDAGAETLEVDKETIDPSSQGTVGNALVFDGTGYVLAGTMTSTLTKGAGLTDVLLVKVDPFGKPLWSRLIGGTGAETVRSIRKTADGGFILCGTNSINGLSSVMVIKTDAEGSLSN